MVVLRYMKSLAPSSNRMLAKLVPSGNQNFLTYNITFIKIMLSDIEIAKSVKLRPINDVAAELGLHEDQIEIMVDILLR